MAPYKHTQIGYLILSVLCAVLIFFIWLYGVITAETSIPAFAIGVMVFVIFILASFGTLTVSVDGQYVTIKFGYGVFRKRFSVSEVVSVERVKNHWYYGWGIKVWFWPYMWIFNVSGFDAVEVIMKNGKIYRIGTDEPNELETAIKQAIQ
jgi:hypothetical protein